MGERRHAALYVVVGLVGAFVVSAIAGVEYMSVAGAGSVVAAADASNLPIPGTIRIEVLNGAGKVGLARDATHRLRGDGFDVVFYGNADRFDHATSMVLDRTGDLARARAVAAALGIDSVATEPDASLLLDATVVLGADWPPLVVEPVPPLDRIRRILAPPDPPE